MIKSLKQIRKESSLSQTKLGSLVGVSQETISQYENGTRTPNFNTAKKIAKELRTPMDDIFFGNYISN